jgi:hypothetical protein
MLELIILWNFGSGMYETAQQKGRSGWSWVFALIVTWFGCQFISAMVLRIGWAIAFGADPGFLIIYVLALASAFVGAFSLGKFLDGQPSLKPPRLPIPPRPRMVTGPPVATSAATMSYLIADGGQQAGPYDLAQLRELWQAGAIRPDSLYWFEGAPDWQPITKLSKLLAS